MIVASGPRPPGCTVPAVTGATDELVGRAAELAAVDAALDALAGGGAAALAVEGEPGIGKTRLLAELRARAEARGLLVLRGAAAEFERDLPYAIVIDALDAYVAAHAGLAGREDLGAILPAAAGSGLSAAPLPDERYRAHRAVAGLLEAVASGSPLVLVLDDAHWADAASLELVAALLQRPPAAPVLIVAAFRPGQAPPRLQSALAAPGVERLALGPLAPAEAAELLGGRADPALVRESGGNPFYLRALASAAPAPGGARLDGVPPAVAAALAAEVAALGTRARQLLEGAAVAGDPFEPALAARVAELPPERTLELLDALLDADLVAPTAVPRRFAFRHPLVRRAVYDAAKGGWRIAAHARAAAALAADGVPPAGRAHHVEQSAAPGDTRAAAVLLDAADATARRAPATAARWYRAALRILPGDGEPRVRALMALAETLRALGECEESRAALVEALDLLPHGDAALRVRVSAAIAAAEQVLGRHEPARRRLAAALAELPDPRSPEAAALTLDLAVAAFFASDFAAMRDRAAEAVALRRAHDRGPGLRAALAALAYAAVLTGDTEEAAAHLQEALSLPGDPDAGQLGELAWAELYLECFEPAFARFGRAVDAARAEGRGQVISLLLQGQATAATVLGRLDVAAELLDRAVEIARAIGNTQMLASALASSGHIAVLRGDREASLRFTEEGVAATAGFEGSFVATLAGLARGSVLIAAGETRQGVAEIHTAGGGAELARVPLPLRSIYFDVLMLGGLASADPAAADAAAARIHATAAALGTPLARARAERAAALTALVGGDPATAAGLAEGAALAADAAGARLDAARTRLLAGHARAALGEREAAIAHLRAAEHAADACGAVRDRTEARGALRALGARREVRGAAGEGGTRGLAALTEREREIADLVCDRRTNKEIAAALFLSGKTVESHLRNIFAKLGASSRVEVARAVEAARATRDDA